MKPSSVYVNTAPREMLLRVPGFGVRNVERILKMRPFKRVTTFDLIKLKVPLERSKYFIVTADRNLDVKQLDSENLIALTAPKQPTQQKSIFDFGANFEPIDTPSAGDSIIAPPSLGA